jgi:hypothetical protein
MPLTRRETKHTIMRMKNIRLLHENHIPDGGPAC